MIDLNITLLIQLINFLVTLVVLNYLLIKPVRAIIKKRRDLATGLVNDAQTFTDDASKKLQRYEEALALAREEGATIRETRKAEALTQESELLSQAQREAQEFLAESRASTQAAVAEAMQAVRARIPDFAALATARLLGKKKRTTA